jgi:hypothetical protein
MGVITIKWTNNDKGLKDYKVFCGHFSLSHRKDFWDEIFCNMLLKIHIIFLIHHIFKINFSWITKFLKKVYRSTKLCVSFWKIILISNCMKICKLFNYLFYCFINCNFFLDVMYITSHLHAVKDSWILKNRINRFLIY